MSGLADRIAEAITGTAGNDLLSCTRVWEAWSYGTMGPDDFTPLGEDPDVLHDIVQAVLAVLPGVRIINERHEDNGPDELPPLSVVLSGGKPAIMQADGTFMDHDGTSYDVWEMQYPLTVLWEPEATR